MLNYGTTAGDLQLPPMDTNYTSKNFQFEPLILTWSYTTVQITPKGYICFDSFNKSCMVAYEFNGDTTITGNVWLRALNNTDLVTQSNTVKSSGFSNFNAIHGFVVTWHNVPLKETSHNFTLQMSFLSDGTNSFFVCPLFYVPNVISNPFAGWYNKWYMANDFNITPASGVEYVYKIGACKFFFIRMYQRLVIESFFNN
jgi:hypothetical protein